MVCAYGKGQDIPIENDYVPCLVTETLTRAVVSRLFMVY